MRYTKSILIAFTTVLAILYGCGVQHHQRQVKKHTERLKTKGVLIPKDTLYITKSDTVVRTFTKNDTTFIEYTIRDTVTLEPTVEVKTRYQTRIEYKYKTKYIKQQAKAEKVKARSNRKGLNWWWFILLILGFFVYLRLTK